MADEEEKKEGKEELKLVSIKIPAGMLEQINNLVKAGRYVSKSEFIRNAIRNELKRAGRVKK